MTRWRAAFAAWMLCGLGGCALLKPGTDKPAAPPPPAPVQVVIEAPDGELRRLLDTHLDIARLARDAAGEEISEPELKRLENGTPAEARALLATEGYMTPVVTLTRETDDAATPPRPRVRIAVAPGTRTSVESVKLEMAGPLAQAAAAGDADAVTALAQWRDAWTLPAGRDFTNPAWRAAKNAAIARLRAAGYAAATWQDTAADVDAQRARAALAVRAESGPLFLTGPLVIEGLARQDEKSVRNLAGFRRGTPATETLLLDYQERLQRSTLFERVSVTLDPDVSTATAAPVTVRVGEAPLQQATVGVGYSSNSGARVSLEHLHRRAFGRRATARNKFELGTLRSAWEGELASHALPGLYRNLIGGAAERVESDTDLVTSLRFRAGRSFDTQRIERLAFAEIERVKTRPVGADDAAAEGVRSDVLALTANFHGVWRDLDSVVLPTRGHSAALESNIGVVRNLQSNDASTLGEGGGPFSRLLVRGNWWRPLGERWYAHARLEVGQVFSRNDVAVPDTQRFRAGGDDSVRGYAWRSLTPQVNGIDVGGRVMATASFEVARPISERLPSIWWATFIDAGNAAERWSDYKPAVGVGVGVRVRSPVGPLRADIAYGERTQKFRLHLSIGIAF